MLSLGLKDFMKFEGGLLVEMVAKDSRDVAILEELRAAGPCGRAPREIWENVRRSTGLKYHHVSRRIKRMNHTLEREVGEHVADKVGRNWALSSFMAHDWEAIRSGTA